MNDFELIEKGACGELICAHFGVGNLITCVIFNGI